MQNIKRKIICTAVGLLMTGMTWVGAWYFSKAVVDTAKYPVFGVDISNYQGDVNWDKLEEQGVKFAFIKATEGSGHTDESARRNIESALKTGIKISAYHFFSFDSAGETQADNYIAAVGDDEITLPPVVDIEYYADKKKNKPSQEETEAILRPLLEKLEEHYGVKPMIYTTLPVYYRYINGAFSEYPLWIRSVNFEPDLVDWTFWQYDDHGKLEGYYGDEEYIDFNVYRYKELK